MTLEPLFAGEHRRPASAPPCRLAPAFDEETASAETFSSVRRGLTRRREASSVGAGRKQSHRGGRHTDAILD